VRWDKKPLLRSLTIFEATLDVVYDVHPHAATILTQARDHTTPGLALDGPCLVIGGWGSSDHVQYSPGCICVNT
jgi:hypothetical protein